jgi:hypothetical protein
MLTSWPAYAVAIGGPCSLLLTQTAYQAGFPMVSLPVITVVSPMASLAVGVGLLGETTQLTALSAVGAGAAVLVAAAGLITLARTGSVPVPAQPAASVQAEPAPVRPARVRPAILGAMRPLALHTATAARMAFGSLAFWAYPAWGTSPYWESIPPEAGSAAAGHGPGSRRPPAHAGPPGR